MEGQQGKKTRNWMSLSGNDVDYQNVNNKEDKDNLKDEMPTQQVSATTESEVNNRESKNIEERYLEIEMESLHLNNDEKVEGAILLKACEETGANQARERIHLLNIFPEEVWELIFDKVDSEGQERLSNSTRLFRQLLLEQRVYFLFPKVWEVLAVKYHQNQSLSLKEQDEAYLEMESPVSYNSDGDEENIILCSACGTERRTRWFSGILRLRLVCKTWSMAIDNLYQKSSYFPEDQDNNDTNAVFIKENTYWTRCRFDDDFDDEEVYVPDFIQHFQNTHVNENRSPFLSNVVNLCFGFGPEFNREPKWATKCCKEEGRRYSYDYIANPPHGERQLPNLLTDLITYYGHHITHCNMFVGNDFPAPNIMVSVFTRMRELLEGMPNLKELQINYNNRPKDSYYEHWHSAGYSDDIRRLLNASNCHPIPALVNLVCLKIKNVPGILFHEILKNNTRISSLYVENDHEHDSEDYCYKIYSGELPSLKKLAINYFSLDEFRNLGNLQVQWSLNELHLDLTHGYRYCHQNLLVNWRVVFSVIQEKWGNTLTKLALSLPEDKHMNEFLSFKFTFHRIKSLKLKVSSYFPLDVCLPMTNTLEHLEILITGGETQSRRSFILAMETKQTVKLFCYLDHPLESNIWTFFHKLQVLKFDNIGDKHYDKNASEFPLTRWLHTRRDWLMKMRQGANKQTISKI